VVAIIAAYNEADIIGHVVGDLIAQGVSVYFLDDGSSDGTLSVVEPLVGHGVIAVERLADTLPDHTPGTFEWERILRRKALLATELDADWFIHHDADEFRESPWPHLSLRDAIHLVDRLGYTAIDSERLDFWPVDDGFVAGTDVRERLTRWCEPEPYDRVQVRCWKKTSTPVDLWSTGGHEARFEGRRIFPIRFVLRHYPVRGQRHGQQKVFDDRRARFLQREREMGWHVQYDALTTDTSFLRDANELRAYDGDALRIGLALRHRGVVELETALAQADRQLTERSSTLDAASHENAALRAAVDDAESRVAAVSLEVERSRAEQRRLAEAVNAALREKAALQTLCDQRVAELDVLRHQLDAAFREKAELEAAHTGLRALHDQRVAEIHGLREALDNAERHVRDLLGSFSWRVTAPARALYRVLTGR
jgi:hypothetical protein